MARTTFAPGRVLGRYRLQKLLGEGGMGSVWQAEDTRIGGTVALKILRPGLVASPQIRSRFAAEARAIRSIHHPHIVQVHDLEMDEDKDCYLVMEYLAGESLTNRIRREKRLPFQVACYIAMQTASALQAAHQAGVFHRDL